MDLHYLWLFYKVAQHLSFSKAAEELLLSQPTVSMQIKKLECELGITLFDRFGRNIYLSREGQFVFTYAEKIFDTVKELEDKIAIQKGQIIGNIHIGASNTPGAYMLPHIIGVFKQKYPDINVHLHIANTHEILNMVITNQVDFAVVGGHYDYKKTFETIKLLDDPVIIIGSPKNPLTQKEYVLAEDLKDQLFITHEPNSNLFDYAQHIIKNDLKIPFNISMMLGNISAIKHAVAANLGISIAPLASVKHDLENGMVSKISIKDKVWEYPFYLIYYGDKNLNVPSKLLIKTIEEKIHDFI
ncbi:MAG: transcriptional regulator, LysR family [Clostridiales bacterium]|nr:transcriptional regulator, LysR family [Clostridiales bacterium]